MARHFNEILFMGAGDQTKAHARMLVSRLQRGLKILTVIQDPNLDAPEDIKGELRDIVADMGMALLGKEIAFADQLEQVRREAAEKVEAAKPKVHLQWYIEDVSFCDPVGVSSPTTLVLSDATCEECLKVYAEAEDDAKKMIEAQ